MQTLLGLILAMSITVVLMPLLMRWAVPLGIIDMPEARKVHAVPIPRVGGLAMGGGVLAAMLPWGFAAQPFQSLTLAIAVLLCFGVWDDRRSLGAAPKFAGQAIAALIVMFWGGVIIGVLTPSDRVPLPEWIALPLTGLFLLGGTNAFNLADGLDGLAGGMSILCFCGTALLAFTVGDVAVGSVAVIFVGAVIGFLRFNTHPARVFMGDGGSQVLGFSAAVLAIVLTQDPHAPLSTALPLLLMGMPIIDTLTVMTERLLAQRSPFKADRRHIHHRLLALGLEHWEAVSALYLLQGLLFVAAWYLRFASDLNVLLVFALFSALVVVPLRLAEYWQLPVRRVPQAGHGSNSAMPGRGSAPWSGSLARGAIGVALSCYALWILAFSVPASADIRLFALLLAIVLLVSTTWRWRQAEVSWVEKAALYSAAALAVYLGRHVNGNAVPASLVEYALFPLLAVAVLMNFRSAAGRPFRLTPLDILVLLVVLTVPNLPNSIASASVTGVTVVELVVLFYSLEVISLTSIRGTRCLRAGAVILLLGLAARSWL
jgi:UDP-GlcNAc:undecaprenyl-phosphate/decaprenyl-phosphate GlcNAc-1-phosphate transferase